MKEGTLRQVEVNYYTSMSKGKCLACGDKREGKNVVPNLTLDCIKNLLVKTKKRIDAGSAEYKHVVDMTLNISDEEKQKVRYHRACRLDIMKESLTGRTKQRS